MERPRLVEESQVRPNAPKTMSLPLTFLDIHLAGPIYVWRQFFYNLPHSTDQFCETTLPTLIHSLSLALQSFFPLAGNLQCPPPPEKPVIECTDKDTVTFTVMESTSDFNQLSSNEPKSLEDLKHLSPELTCKSKTKHGDVDDDAIVFPLVALQATVFPSSGVCIAITYCHVMDDRCCDQLMRTWSSLCKKSFGKVAESPPPPCFDREVLKDPKGLEAIFLRDYFHERATWNDKLIIGRSQSQSQTSESSKEQDYVKATIVFSKEQIEGIKSFALKQLKTSEEEFKAPQYLSKFVVTCAFVWNSLVKTRHRDNNHDADEDEENNMEEEFFRFAADCRGGRIGYPIPETYFGNCITICYAKLKRMDLKGEGGFLKAVRVIERAINDMKSEPFRGAENWKESFTKMIELGSGLLVTGSPKFAVYETDFGFGRPSKVEMLHSTKVMSIAETGENEGGVEVGLVFRKGGFKSFDDVVKQGLEAFKS